MKWLRRLLYLILVLALLISGFMFYLVRRSFPREDGEVTAPGLAAPVEVIRDLDGVPHIFAETAHDLYFAQGYVEAQDRFWQMDFWRHIGAGRVSEMLGSATVETDMFLRALGFTDLARREIDSISDESRRVLEWYAEGVNAYLAEHRGAEVSLEYAILGVQNSSYQIEPWTPLHTLTWAKLMSWDLSANMRAEIARTVLSAGLPQARVEQLFPDYPEGHPVIVPTDQVTVGRESASPLTAASPALLSAARGAEAVSDLTGGGFEGIGSNNWVVGGGLTETGAPILANDPHLGIQMPSIWYEVGLHCTGADCVQDKVGFGFPGTPGVVVGHNEHIAWGVTNQAVDTQDLYIERVNPNNPHQYEVDGEWVDMDIREETIGVAGGEDVTYEVLTTRHGPVISGIFIEEGELDGGVVDLPEDYVVSLRWQSLQPSTLSEAVIRLNEATNYREFREAMSLWDIAAQNIVYADIEGNIAYQSTGEVPIRAKGDGRYPVPGWSSEYEWAGLVPFEDMPRLLNPPRGWIESANQPVTPPGGGPFEGWDGAHGYRGFRIEQMLQAGSEHSVTSFGEMQMDEWDGGAAALVPRLLAVESGSPQVVRMQELLEAWSRGAGAFQASGGSAAAAAYETTWSHLLALTFQDELPEDYWPDGGARWYEVVRRLLETPADPWWDDIGTDEVETRDVMLEAAMMAADDELTERLGSDPDGWTWGELHVAWFENQSLGQSGIAPIEWLFNRAAPARVGGGPGIVHATGWDANISYQVDWVPSFRMVVDLGDLARSTSIHTTGQSGHAFHRHYADMLERWTDGGSHQMRWTRDQIEDGAEGRLTLLPG